MSDDWFRQSSVSRECQDNTINIFHPPVSTYANPKAKIPPLPLQQLLAHPISSLQGGLSVPPIGKQVCVIHTLSTLVVTSQLQASNYKCQFRTISLVLPTLYYYSLPALSTLGSSLLQPTPRWCLPQGRCSGWPTSRRSARLPRL